MTDNGVDYEAVGHVAASHYRQHVLDELAAAPATPSAMANEDTAPMQHCSRALQDLRERGLVELLVPEDRKKGRLYGITGEGIAVHSAIQNGEVQV